MIGADDEDLDDSLSAEDLPSLPPEVRERVIRRVHAREAAERAALPPPPPQEARRPPSKSGPTIRSAAWSDDAPANDATERASTPVPAPGPPVRTAPALDLPPEVRAMQAALPFQPAPAVQEPPPPPAARTLAARVEGRDEPGKTAPLGDTSIARAVAAALPFRAPEPALTLRQYACLCVELERWPERAAEVLGRYRLDGAGLAAVREHWGRVCAGDPEALGAFARDGASYAAWLQAQWG